MVWDGAAYGVTIKAISTVESNFNYGAINPSDAITLGIAQWYGTRAANLLFRIKNEATAAFNAYCPASISAAMTSHPATDSWWNSRHVTREESIALKNLLTRAAVKTIQVDQFATDIAGYLTVAQNWGLNINTQTQVVQFFCTIYHQSPRAASQIVGNLPSGATLDTIYQAALNNAIVGDYRTRQTTAYNIIKGGDTGEIDTSIDDPTIDETNEPPTDGEDSNGGGGGGGGNRRRSQDHHIVKRGNTLILYRKNGGTTTFYKSGGIYLAADSGGVGAKYTNPNTGGGGGNGDDDGETPTIPTNPGGPTGGTPSAAAAAVIAFARDKLGDLTYSQGPGRLTPATSGYSDCSAFLIWAFQSAANVSLGGTYTGNLCTRGTLVKEGRPTEAEMNPGDLIFLRWGSAVRANSPFDHVELYCGGGRMISMGRTPGPTESAWDSDINYALGRGGRVQVRRYLR